MLELYKGVDILTDVGGVTTMEEARTVIEQKLDAVNQQKLAPITNEDALIKIAAAINMCEPDDVFINTGSPQHRQPGRPGVDPEVLNRKG
jgi:phosphoenolpyruvate carboxykinase (GTP)